MHLQSLLNILSKIGGKFKQATRFLLRHWLATFLVTAGLIVAGQKGFILIYMKFFMHPPVSHVETLLLSLQPHEERLQAVGTVKVAKNVTIRSEVSGVVESLQVQSGSPVKSQDVLINIAHQDIAASLAKNQALLAQKTEDANRAEQMFKIHAIAATSLLEAQSELQEAKADVDGSEALINKYVIRAPFPGQTGIWQVDVGQYVKPGDDLITLTQFTPTYVDFSLSASALSSVKVGEDIEFTTPSYPNRLWKGKVMAIDPALDSDTRSIAVRAEINNADHVLVPMLYGQVSVVKKLAPILTIPQEAVLYDPDGASVYVLQNHLTKKIHVVLGDHVGDAVVVLSGLKPRDELVTAGAMKLFPGMPVVVNAKVTQR